MTSAPAELAQLRSEVARLNNMLVEQTIREAALRESEQHYHDLANLLPETVFEMDEVGRITFASSAAIAQFGYSEAELGSGLNVIMMIAPEDRQRAVTNIGRVLAGEQPLAEEYNALRKDGTTFPAFVSTSRILREGVPTGLRGFVVDITDLRRLRDERDDLLYRVSHDLASPLAVIRVQLEIIQQLFYEVPGHPPIPRGVDAIAVAVQRLTSMVGDLEDSIRLESGQLHLTLVALDMGAFLRNLVERVVGVLEVGRVRVDVEDPLAPVLADPDRVERIILNLLTNALKFSPSGTPITITAVRVGDTVVTTVADRGPGISEEERPQLFQRFRRLPRNSKGPTTGLGLGLYAARRLVEAQGGLIWVDTSPAHGSRFSFSLPLANRV